MEFNIIPLVGLIAIIGVGIPIFIKGRHLNKLEEKRQILEEEVIDNENPYLLKFEVEGLGVKHGKEIKGYYNSRFNLSARDKSFIALDNSYSRGYFTTNTGVSYPVSRVLRAWIEEKSCK